MSTGSDHPHLRAEEQLITALRSIACPLASSVPTYCPHEVLSTSFHGRFALSENDPPGICLNLKPEPYSSRLDESDELRVQAEPESVSRCLWQVQCFLPLEASVQDIVTWIVDLTEKVGPNQPLEIVLQRFCVMSLSQQAIARRRLFHHRGGCMPTLTLVTLLALFVFITLLSAFSHRLRSNRLPGWRNLLISCVSCSFSLMAFSWFVSGFLLDITKSTFLLAVGIVCLFTVLKEWYDLLNSLMEAPSPLESAGALVSTRGRRGQDWRRITDE